MSKRFLLSLAAIALAGEAFASGAPPQVTVTSSPVGTQINTLPSSNPAGTSDTVAFPFQGVTGGVPVAVQSGSVVTGQASLTVGSSTGNVALGSAGPVVQVYNPGSAVVYVKLGNNAVTAASTDTPIAAGSYLILNTGGVATYIAAIAPTGTPTLTITTGTGTPLGWGGGGGGGSGGGTSSTFGAAFPSTGTAIGVSSGGNMVALTLGQTTMSASVPVAIASNQGALTVTQGTAAGSGPWITTPWIGGAVNSTTNGTYSNLLQGNVLLGATNGIYANILQGNAVLSATNPIFTTGSIGGAAISATNGGYVNLLQGNAVNASGNPIFAQITAGSAIVGKVGIDQTTDGTTNAVHLTAGTNLAGKFGIDQTTPGTTNGVVVNSGTITTTVSSSSSITNPTSTLALPSSTSAYTIGQLLCTNATAGTCNTALASEFFSIVNSAGGASIARLRLSINDSTSTAWGAQTIQIDLWTAAPTMTNGDRGTYLLTTGSATHLATYTCNMSAVQGDGVYGECALNTSGFAMIKLASGTSVFWTADALTGSGTTGASKTVTLTAELAN